MTNDYLDDATPAEAPCTGDAFSCGASGPWINRTIPDTDPRSGTTNVLRGRCSLTHLPPGATAADADRAWQRFVDNLSASASNRP